MRLDYNERFPSGMEDYLKTYGWHFSKKMCQWAVSKMRNSKGEKVEYVDKEAAQELMKKFSLEVESVAYDLPYVLAMAKADYYKSSVPDDSHLALFVKDYFTDHDGYKDKAFTRFYADCIGTGEMPIWEDMI